MIHTRRRSALAGTAALGVVALLGLGYWIGRTYPASTVRQDILHGTVTEVTGEPLVEAFAIDLDPPRTVSTSYFLGIVSWTTSGGGTAGGHNPPCVVVGRHITFGVVHVVHDRINTDRVVWIDCSGD
jgi:hypothetical protein